MICRQCKKYFSVTSDETPETAECPFCQESQPCGVRTICQCRSCGGELEVESWCVGEQAECPLCGAETVLDLKTEADDLPIPRFRDVDVSGETTEKTAASWQTQTGTAKIPPSAVDYADRLEQSVNSGGYTLPPRISPLRIYRKQIIFYAGMLVLLTAAILLLCGIKISPAALNEVRQTGDLTGQPETFQQVLTWAWQIQDPVKWVGVIIFVTGMMISLRLAASEEKLPEKWFSWIITGIIFTGPLFAVGYGLWRLAAKLHAKLAPHLAPETELQPEVQFFAPSMEPVTAGDEAKKFLEKALRLNAFSLHLNPGTSGWQYKICGADDRIIVQKTIPADTGKNLIAQFRQIAQMENCGNSLQKSYFFIQCGDTLIRSAIFTALLGDLGTRATFYFCNWSAGNPDLNTLPLPELFSQAVESAADRGGVILVSGDRDGTFTGALLRRFAAYGQAVKVGDELSGKIAGIPLLQTAAGTDTGAAELLRAVPEYRFAAVDVTMQNSNALKELIELAAGDRVVILNMKDCKNTAESANLFARLQLDKELHSSLLAAVTPYRCSLLCRACAEKILPPDLLHHYRLDTAGVSRRKGCQECGDTGINGSLLICRCHDNILNITADDGEMAMLILASRGVIDAGEVDNFITEFCTSSGSAAAKGNKIW